MKKITISINGKAPFETRKIEELEFVLSQMLYFKNIYHNLPNYSFSVSASKTILVNWIYLDNLLKEVQHNSIVYLDQLTKKILESV